MRDHPRKTRAAITPAMLEAGRLAFERHRFALGDLVELHEDEVPKLVRDVFLSMSREGRPFLVVSGKSPAEIRRG